MPSPFEDNPFSDKPSYPDPAFVDRNSPRRYKPQNDDDDDFVAFPESTRRSPDIFTRSGRINANINKVALNNTPNLQFEGRTARAQFTSRESPKRQKAMGIAMDDTLDHDDDDAESINLTGSPHRGSQYGRSVNSSHRSERFLEPPQPIFSPETYAEANPYEDDEDDQETIGRDSYDYDSYQKAQEFEERSLYSESTAYHSSASNDGYTNGSESEYFAASIDNDMMNNIKSGFVPNREKTITKRKVRLVDGQAGHLVLENPVPEELRKVLTRTESPFGEFTNMTYSACTSEPDDFIKDGFSLRAAKYNRETELVICVTMYNEDEYAFARTMHAIMKNIAHLCSRNKSAMWGKDSWKKIQVVIVADGRNKVNESVLQLLTATGVYQGNLARPYVNNKKVNAHIFEYTTQISIDENLKFKGDEKSLAPVQVLFCLKEKNQKKINSHRWLFNAFCPLLDPNVVVLLDVGTKPDNHAIYNLWKAFDRDSNVAGAAGEIKAMKGKGWINLTNPLVASQNFEYKMSNILDKPLESLFGYISVLPGALSAYRYIALTNHDDGSGPLDAYFKGEDLLNTSKAHSNTKTNFFEANMYLAEDRILCWELVAKRNENWVLKFVKSATAETDVPETISEFLSQRRRWINGAFFAALYALKNSKKIWQTDHSIARKFWFHVEFIYQFITLVFSFFSLSNFYLTFYFLTGSLIDEVGHNGGFWIFTIFNYLCIGVLTSLFIVSIGNRPQGSRGIFKTLIILLTVCALYALVVGIYFVANTIKEYGIGDSSTYVMISIIVSLLSTYGLYTLMSVLYLDPWHMLTCSIQYFLMIPSYTCTLQIFAFCNTHDVSWGTKGDNNPKEDLSNQYIIEKNEEGEFEAVVLNVNIDEVYLETLYNIRAKRSSKKVLGAHQPDDIMDGEDYAKDVRTRVVLIWMLSNLVFIMTMLQVFKAGETKQNYYLGFILWSVAFLALIRAIGSFGYLIQNYARFFVETKSKWLHKRQGYNLPNAHKLN
ncbi:Chitin synthase, class 2 [Yamadazyma tenuis]|uniref:Chitin synthase n=1 Tax=Candida tenuis (strain ATCC 10573 / BCRC 21748 / CBS 615 / JCM 9827 / NBRC 10315 / NRRL Y-1498 / VKM Y-70) TaxID=590646 RepID=G3B5L5_CANTC|nr:uncharacterized protein CANTEDRAFT_106977 [Yamadazyma tenuis ATCC 10573]EGV63258.1 hypothetical protein CANTEDRAFT_106977 [Yamadazyma tenuis ATCC 10573]WEJ96926.1 Chitin synthase, class 2 [Yamadazyma tenuis]